MPYSVLNVILIKRTNEIFFCFLPSLQFLIRNDKSDLLILKQTKDAVRVSICHTGTVIANGYMHCGTTHDSFLLDNLEWLSRATNW